MTLEIYMKSGNIIKDRNVKKWEAGYRGNEITRLSITHKHKTFLDLFRPRKQLKVETIDLSQIEAIVEVQ
jgi:hypothetical protein